MWKFTAKYEDFNGNQKEKDIYFNLTTTELIKLQNSVKGGIDTVYDKIIEENDNVALMSRFEEIIKLAYGVKGEDGESFLKSDKIYEDFKQTLAYDAFMEYLLTSENGASNFINGIMPAKVKAKLNTPEGKKLAAEHGVDVSALGIK